MRNVLSIVVSCLICGSGHFIKGYRKRGLIFFAVFAVALGLALICVYVIPSPLSKVGVVGFGILALWIWLYQIIDVCTLGAACLPATITRESEERYRQAMALLIRGNRADARIIFEQMIKENKSDIDSYFQLGKIACEENNLKLAKKYFDRCQRLPGGDKWMAEINDILEGMQEESVATHA